MLPGFGRTGFGRNEIYPDHISIYLYLYYISYIIYPYLSLIYPGTIFSSFSSVLYIGSCVFSESSLHRLHRVRSYQLIKISSVSCRAQKVVTMAKKGLIQKKVTMELPNKTYQFHGQSFVVQEKKTITFAAYFFYVPLTFQRTI